METDILMFRAGFSSCLPACLHGGFYLLSSVHKNRNDLDYTHPSQAEKSRKSDL